MIPLGIEPEKKARKKIDVALIKSGWTVQNREDMNLFTGRGVAVREFPLSTEAADDLLFVNLKAIGAFEAKAEGHT